MFLEINIGKKCFILENEICLCTNLKKNRLDKVLKMRLYLSK